jgi:alginate O-acetyltransferase complex protein AlgI
MLFNPTTFIIFSLAVLGGYYSPLSWRAKKIGLLLASYVFYAALNPPFVTLIWLSTLVDWFVAKRMGESIRPNARRALLLISLSTNLGLLGFFEYGDFLLGNFMALVGAMGIDYSPPPLGIVLPVGISFYTFQTLSPKAAEDPRGGIGVPRLAPIPKCAFFTRHKWDVFNRR